MTDDSASLHRLRRLATYASVATAALLILVKLGAFIATDSVAMLSSLADSTVDALASVVTLLGVRQAMRPADRGHRYGHGKFESLAALAQALFICGSAAVLAYEAINRLIRPKPVEEGMLGVAVMVFAVLVTAALVLFQRHVISRTGSVAISADSIHYSGDLFVNLAVIAALLLTQATGVPAFDPLFALGIAGFLLFGVWRIARTSIDILMDKELDPKARRRIRAIVMAHPQTRGMHDLRTRSGGDRVFIEFHLELDGHLTVSAAHDITDEVEAQVTQAFPNAEVIAHQEPAGLDDERLDHRLPPPAGQPR